jgi:hypothetical protein
VLETSQRKEIIVRTAVDNNAPAARQAFKIETFPDRDNWMRLLLADDALSPSAKVVAQRLALHLNVKSGRCDPSLDRLAQGTGMSRSTMKRTLQDLDKAGWIGIRRSSGGRSLSGHGYCHSFEFLTPAAAALNRFTDEPVGDDARGSNQTTNRVKSDDQPVQIEGGNRFTVGPLTENRTEKRTERTAKVALAGSGHSKNRFKTGNQRLTTWPADLILNGEWIAIAAGKGFNTKRAGNIFEKFKCHHRAKGSRHADWTAAWEGWVLNQVDFDAKAKVRETDPSSAYDGRL